MTDPIVYADDLQPGQRHELGIHTVSESELVDFASQWDPQAFHVDRAAAESGAFGGLIASGIHSLAIAQRLAVSSVLTSWSVIAGRGSGRWSSWRRYVPGTHCRDPCGSNPSTSTRAAVAW